MHHIDLPLGSAIRLTAIARPNLGRHRWDVRLFSAGAAETSSPARLNYGSEIGDGDDEQRIDVPMQDRDCRIEVTCGQATADGWRDQVGKVGDNTPGLLVLGYSDPGAAAGGVEDVVLSFAFSGVPRPA